jgi:type I restriction enzyme S subunit
VAALVRVRKKLRRYRSAVLHAAVTGRLTAEWRQAHGEPAEPGDKLLARILMERRKQWEQRTLAKYAKDGRTPPKNWQARYVEPIGVRVEGREELCEGWTWATVEQLTRGDRDSAYGVLKPGPDVPGGVPLIRIGDMENGRVDVAGLKHINPEIANVFKRTFIEGGELLMSLVGTIGRTAIAPIEAKGANTARAVGVIPVSPLVNVQYVEYWFRNPTRVHQMTRKSHEVARKTLNLEDVRPTLVALPPLSEQAEIVEAVNEKLSQIEAMEAEVERGLARAGRMRQAILKAAFEGKLVPQDPTDEPAAAMLERIKVERTAAVAARPARGRRTRKMVSR